MAEKAVDTEIKIAHDGRDHETTANDRAVAMAKAATDKEHRMSLWEGIRTYPKAIFWSMFISLCIAMEAFDVVLLKTFCRYFRVI